MGSSFENLLRQVIEKSESKEWANAVLEWELIDTFEDLSSSSTCVCGKESIRYLHKIGNSLNGNILYPIGSSCIKKFGRCDLNETIDLKEKLFVLSHAVASNAFLELNADLFSRKLIKYLYEAGAFESKLYPAGKNYEFFLKMFNKRNKEDITELQRKKITAILLNNIKPFILNQIKNKIISNRIS